MSHWGLYCCSRIFSPHLTWFPFSICLLTVTPLMNFPYKTDDPGLSPLRVYCPRVSFSCLCVTHWDCDLRMCSLPFLHGIVFIQFLVCVWDGLTCSTDWFELFEIGWPWPWTCDNLPSSAPKCWDYRCEPSDLANPVVFKYPLLTNDPRSVQMII